MELEAPAPTEGDDGGRCLCGRDSTEGSAEDESLSLQVFHLKLTLKCMYTLITVFHFYN